MSQLFFLSVACYVVKPNSPNCKSKEKCVKQKEIRHFQKKPADFVELLSRFELETSSLPIHQTPFCAVPIHVSNTRQSLRHNGFRVIVYLPFPARFTPSVGRFVGNTLTRSRRIQCVHVSCGSFSCQSFSRSISSCARPVSFAISSIAIPICKAFRAI